MKIGYSKSNIPIEVNFSLITDATEKANVFAKKFQSNLVSGKHSFQNFNDKLMRARMDSKNEYNKKIIMDELLYAIQISKVKSPGLDSITIDIIKYIPEESIMEILILTNQSYMTEQGGASFKAW